MYKIDRRGGGGGPGGVQKSYTRTDPLHFYIFTPKSNYQIILLCEVEETI